MPCKKLWTTKEVEILNEHFKTSGIDACARLLPGRSYDAIRSKALSLGILQSTRKQRCGRKNIWTAEQDAYLRDFSDQHTSTIARHISREFGIKRTPAAIYKRMQKLGIIDCIDADAYSSTELSALLGISMTSVRRWISAGALPAKRGVPVCARGRQTGWKWRIAHDDLRKALRSNPALLARVRKTADTLWLADLLGEINTQQPARREISVCDLPEYRVHMSGAYL